MSLIEKSPAPIDAAEWHSRIASQFDGRYTKSPAFRERLEVWSKLIETYTTSESTVLDAGCGSGVLSLVAAGQCRTVLGIDGAVEMIRLCDAKKSQLGAGNAEFRLLRLEDIGTLAQPAFDCILCSSVLEYLPDFWGMLDRLAAKLSPSGVLLFSVPNTSSVYRRIERASYRLSGKPAYLGLVQSALPRKAIEAGLASRKLEVLATRYYAATPGLSNLARPLGLTPFTDNLLVFACRTRKAG